MIFIPKTKELFLDLLKLFGNMISKTKLKACALQQGGRSGQLILNGKKVFQSIDIVLSGIANPLAYKKVK